MERFTKESLTAELKAICNVGWIQSCKKAGNDGAVGNTVEQLLGITENNKPLADAGVWELKGQRRSQSQLKGQSLLTLFHFDPSPRQLGKGVGLFNQFLLPNYGWPLKDHPEEWSFRLTIGTVPPVNSDLDRGFRIILNETKRHLALSFQADKVAVQQRDWLQTVEERIGLGEINPQPYWLLDDLKVLTEKKLMYLFYLLAEAKVQDGIEYFWYDGLMVLEGFKFDSFLKLLKTGVMKVDFDARTGFRRDPHNHGTKFRIPRAVLPTLYTQAEILMDNPIPSSELRKMKVDTTNVHKIGAILMVNDLEKSTSKTPLIIQDTLFEAELRPE